MAGLHRDLEQGSGPLGLSIREQQERRSLEALAEMPLSSVMPDPTPGTISNSLETLVEHALRAGASQLHLTPNEAPAGRFGDLLRTFAGLDRCDSQAVTSMLESALDPRSVVVLNRKGSVSRTTLVPSLGWLRVHAWHDQDGVRGIVHLPRRRASKAKRLGQSMVRALIRGHR